MWVYWKTCVSLENSWKTFRKTYVLLGNSMEDAKLIQGKGVSHFSLLLSVFHEFPKPNVRLPERLPRFPKGKCTSSSRNTMKPYLAPSNSDAVAHAHVKPCIMWSYRSVGSVLFQEERYGTRFASRHLELETAASSSVRSPTRPP